MDSLILHIDVDAFFASVEQLLIPALRGRAVIVGCGVIASCSYEARRLGLHAGMALHQAKRLCPQAVVLEGDYQVYRCFADAVWDICRRYTCGLETYLDEAYGDATGMDRLYGGPATIGRKLQADVRNEVGLPVSVGLAENRMLAKIASSSAKPNGVAWVAPGREAEFLDALAIRKLPGVGRSTEQKLRDMSVETVGQLKAFPRELLRSMFGQRGEVLYERCRGRDVASDRPALARKLPRSISRETTFHRPTGDGGEVAGMLFYLLERAARAARDQGLLAGALEVSIRYDDWKGDAVRRTLPQPTGCENELFAAARTMLDRLHTRRVALRHVGIVLSSFAPAGAAATLFTTDQDRRDRRLHQAVDGIRDRYGHAAVVSGESIELLGKLKQNDYGFVLRTPSLTK